MIKGLTAEGAEKLLQRRSELENGQREHSRRERSGSGFRDVAHLMRSVPLSRKDLEALAESGALEALETERRQALWAVRSNEQLSLFRDVDLSGPKVSLPKMHSVERMGLDYERVRLSIHDHPLRYLRKALDRRGVLSAEQLGQRTTGDQVKAAGLVLARQRPGTASGVVFVTLEDETGVMNLVFYSRIFERFRLAAQHSPLLLVSGKVERQDPKPGSVDLGDPRQERGVASIIHLIVRSAERLDAPRITPNYRSRDFH